MTYCNGGLKPRLMHMTLRREPFERILAGVKKVEYRIGSDYWKSRLLGHEPPKLIRFALGYMTAAPAITVECLGIRASLGEIDYETDPNIEKDFSEGTVALDEAEKLRNCIFDFQIKLGKVVKVENVIGYNPPVSDKPLNPRKYITKK